MSARNVLFVSFYTPRYAASAARLRHSLQKLGLQNVVMSIPDKGGWLANVRHKPTFLRNTLHALPGTDAIVWIDADAVVRSRPELFFEMEEDVGVHYRDGIQLCAGTMYFRNNARVRTMIDAWIEATEAIPQEIEQITLHGVLMTSDCTVRKLDTPLCKMFGLVEKPDRGREIVPIIEHFQESRRVVKPERFVREREERAGLGDPDAVSDLVDYFPLRIAPYRNLHKGEHAWVFGKGPSLDRFDFAQAAWPRIAIKEAGLVVPDPTYCYLPNPRKTDGKFPVSSVAMVYSAGWRYAKELGMPADQVIGFFQRMGADWRETAQTPVEVLAERNELPIAEGSANVVIQWCRFIGASGITFVGFDSFWGGGERYAQSIEKIMKPDPVDHKHAAIASIMDEHLKLIGMPYEIWRPT